MKEVVGTPTTAQIYKVSLASIVGSIIEQYDFLVTGVIAATSGAASSSNYRALLRWLQRSASIASALSSDRSGHSFSATSLIGAGAKTRWPTR